MTKGKWTPGPWRLNREMDATIRSVVGPKGKIIIRWSRVSAPQSVESEANARLIAAAPDMFVALHEGRRAIGDHSAPSDCYATGPVTGDPIRDLVQCPACSFIAMYDTAIAKATGGSS